LALDIATAGLQAAAERSDQVFGLIGRPGAEKPDHRHRRRLRARGEGPGDRGRTAERGNELSSSNGERHLPVLDGFMPFNVGMISRRKIEVCDVFTAPRASN
jgi:hypothetical protein